jgi:hypothetical protein
MTTTIDGRLTAVSRCIDELEARMHVHGPDDRQRIRRHVHALRQEQANALAATRHAPDRIDDRVARLRSRLEVAERSFDADLAGSRSAFTAAVDGELQGWDVFAERLQTTAAARTGTARAQAEAGITELRRRRLAVSDRLDDLRVDRWETWHEQRKRVTAARDELERTADDLSASLF